MGYTIINNGQPDGIPIDEKGMALGVATLDSNARIPNIQLPPLAISEVFVVVSNAARDDLTAESGDMAKVTSDNRTYVYDGNSWIEITTNQVVNLSELNDVSLNSLLVNNILIYNGSEWINTPLQISMSGISDVLLNTLSNGQVLIYNNTNQRWENKTITLLSVLNDLLDVTINLPTTGQILIKSGSDWINDNLTIDKVIDLWTTLDSKLNLNTLSSNGDLLCRIGGVTTRYAIGSSGQYLRVTGGLPIWTSIPTSDITNLDTSLGLKVNSSILSTNGDILFNNGTITTRLPRGTNNQVLKSTSTSISWTDNNLSTVADVNLNTPLNTQVLTYDTATSKWINANQIGVTYPLLAPTGTNAAPSYSFSSSTNTGMRYIFQDSTPGILFNANGFELCYWTQTYLKLWTRIDVRGTNYVDQNTTLTNNTLKVSNGGADACGMYGNALANEIGLCSNNLSRLHINTTSVRFRDRVDIGLNSVASTPTLAFVGTGGVNTGIYATNASTVQLGVSIGGNSVLNCNSTRVKCEATQFHIVSTEHRDNSLRINNVGNTYSIQNSTGTTDYIKVDVNNDNVIIPRNRSVCAYHDTIAGSWNSDIVTNNVWSYINAWTSNTSVIYGSMAAVNNGQIIIAFNATGDYKINCNVSGLINDGNDVFFKLSKNGTTTFTPGMGVMMCNNNAQSCSWSCVTSLAAGDVLRLVMTKFAGAVPKTFTMYACGITITNIFNS